MSYSISVVVTIYNLEKYLARCLDSIIKQQYPIKELILVDDGSLDNSYSICQEYKANNSNIIILQTDRVGTAAARMEGTQKASGDYIAYVDGDDWIEATMYLEYMKLANLYSPDVIIGEIIKDYEDTSIRVKNRIKQGVYTEKEHADLIENMLDCGPFSKGGIHASLCSKVFKKDKIKTYIDKVDKRIIFGEDAAVLYPFLINCNDVIITDLTGYHWVMRNDSKTHTHDLLYLEELNYLDNYLRPILSEDKMLPFMLNQIQNALHREFNFCNKYEIHDKYDKQKELPFLFPFELVEKEDRVLIYGNGMVGKSFCTQLKNGYCSIVSFVDTRNFDNEYFDVIRPEQIKEYDFDKLVIAVEKEEVAKEIKDLVIAKGVEENKIVWKNYRIE